MKVILNRRRFVIAAGLIGIALSLGVASSASAQNFPQRPITMLVGFAAGGPTDSAARVVAEQMAKRLGQPVVVSNKPGASGVVAAKELIASAPDGYTILLASNSYFTHGPARYESVDYDYDKDFTPIGGVAGYPHVLIVPPNSAHNSLKDLIDYARANPNKLNVARVGFGNEIALAWLADLAKIDIATIPYKGAATVVSDLSGGRLDLALVAPSVAYPLIDGGKAKAIATTRSTPMTDKRNIPSVATAGVKEFDFYIWNALVAPKGTPQPVIDTLAKALNDSLKEPAVQAQFATAFLDIASMSAEDLTKAVHDELAMAKKVVKDANLPLLKQQ